MIVRVLWLVFAIGIGCHTDKIYQDTGRIGPGVLNLDDGDERGDPGEDLPEDTGPGPETDEDGDGHSVEDGDCDDGDAAIHPGAAELCNGLDDDCDGTVDEDLVYQTWYQDLDGDGWGGSETTVAACEAPEGYVSQAGDCDDTDATTYRDAPEVCDGVDNDCDTLVDEDATTRFYRDMDGDGYGDPSAVQDACLGPSGFVAEGTDCDDTDPTVSPEGVEVCDGMDNDCDGEVDEDGSSVWYEDTDGDGEGDVDAVHIGCDAPDGHVATPFDCDDSDPDVHPGATELCNGVDDDCDTEVDESAVDAPTWYPDLDGDGYGDGDTSASACEAPSGHVLDATDCDDSDVDVHPDAEERCNGVDDDCDGAVDTDDPDLVDGVVRYRDADGDGWGDASAMAVVCEEPSGWTDEPGDCDDLDPDISPDGTEVCDGLDNDCDGVTDPGALDSDGDGIANCVDETVYYRDFSSDSWEGWTSWDLGGYNPPNWTLTGRYLVEVSNAANAIAHSPNLGTLDEFTLSVDIMQGGRLNNGCGIAFAVDPTSEVMLIEWRDPTDDYEDWWYPGAIILYERTGSWSALGSVSSAMDLSRDYLEWATLSVTVSGSLIQIYLDDVLVLTHTYSGALVGPGSVGVWTWDNDGGVYFDNVMVTQPPP